MPIKDPEKRKEYHSNYMKNVWYPKNKEKHKGYVRRNKVKRRAEIKEFINDIRKNSKCKACGTDDWRVLCFHHRSREEKDFGVYAAIGRTYSFEKILAEIKKCDVLCLNCHHLEHHYKDGLTGT